ncbi:MAG TPA: hypothetical protein VNW50_06940 [Streptosporangiaceae bacterium]|nr:hypothetical protein [Streptosporangiaceae bacterium]
MDNPNLGPTGQGAVPAAARRSGRSRRVATTIAASAVLLGSGVAIGIALTGGASASSGTSASAGSPAAVTATSLGALRCAKIVARIRASEHPAAAMRLGALCSEPLLRLALVGGQHGQVTFKGKSSSPKTIAFERGTVESVTGSAVTVKAPDGTMWTWDLTASTTVRAAGQDTAQAKLATGDRIFVGGPVVSGARDARLIRIRATG